MLLPLLALSAGVALAHPPTPLPARGTGLQAHQRADGTLHAGDPAGPQTCLTGVVQELRAGLDALPADQQADVLAAIEPWRQRWAAQGAPPPESCVGRYGESWVEGEHFSVEWDGTTISESTAQAFLNSLEYSWDIEVDELGWIGPAGATSRPILVYVQSGNGAGAYTSITECTAGSQRYMPYIVAYSGSFSAGSWYQTMAAHEFNHASQFYYGYAHEFYWWEATATWIEEYVYPTHNDWADPIYYGYSLQPHLAFNASDQQDEDVFWHMYAMAVWAKYLDQYVGGQELIRSIWEAAGSYPSTYYGLWMPDAIEDVGLSFEDLYPEFMAVAAFMDFDEPEYFRQPATADEIDSLPAEGGGEEGDDDLPQSLGQNFIRFDADIYVPDATLQITFNGSNDADQWFAVLARGDGHTLDTHVALVLDEGGAGTAEIAMVEGAEYFLIVSPIDQSAVGSNYNWSRATEFSYSWSAEAIPDPSGGGGGNGDGSGGGAGGEGGEGKVGVCGHTPGTAPAGMVLWLAPLALAVLRRRSVNEAPFIPES